MTTIDDLRKMSLGDLRKFRMLQVKDEFMLFVVDKIIEEKLQG